MRSEKRKEKRKLEKVRWKERTPSNCVRPPDGVTYTYTVGPAGGEIPQGRGKSTTQPDPSKTPSSSRRTGRRSQTFQKKFTEE